MVSIEGGPFDPTQMWSQFVSNMEPVIRRVVKFCKKLPGEFLRICSHRRVEREKDVVRVSWIGCKCETDCIRVYSQIIETNA